MNKGRWASIRLVARRSVCSAVDVSVILVSLPWSAITRLNLRRRPKQVYWSREQFGKIGRHALSREDFGQRQRKSAGTPGRGTHGQAKIQVASGCSIS